MESNWDMWPRPEPITKQDVLGCTLRIGFILVVLILIIIVLNLIDHAPL